MSPGPTGVDGLTMIAGSPCSAISSLHDRLGLEFRALVGADHVVGTACRFLVGDPARDDPQRGDAAGVDDPLDPGGEGGKHQRPRAFDIDAEHRRGVGHPQPVIGRDVKQIAAAHHRRGERSALFERAFDDLDGEPLEIAAIAPRPHQHAHRMPGPRAARAPPPTPTNPVAPVTRHNPEGSDIGQPALM